VVTEFIIAFYNCVCSHLTEPRSIALTCGSPQNVSKLMLLYLKRLGPSGSGYKVTTCGMSGNSKLNIILREAVVA
jgi:hypothetical protein